MSPPEPTPLTSSITQDHHVSGLHTPEPPQSTFPSPINTEPGSSELAHPYTSKYEGVQNPPLLPSCKARLVQPFKPLVLSSPSFTPPLADRSMQPSGMIPVSPIKLLVTHAPSTYPPDPTTSNYAMSVSLDPFILPGQYILHSPWTPYSERKILAPECLDEPMEPIPGKCTSAEDGNNSETSTVRPNYASDDQIDVGALMNVAFHEDQVMNSILDHGDSVPYDHREVQVQNAVCREQNGIDPQNNNSQTDSEDGDNKESEDDSIGSEQA